MRTWPLVAPIALASALSGCIIYEEHFYTDKCVDADCPTGDDDDRGDDDTTPTTPEPEVTRDYALTVNEGRPGDVFLSFLVPTVPDVDVAGVVRVQFERDVEVVDAQNREFEVVLLLSVDPEAEPGDSEVILHTDDGQLHLLAEPFRIVGGTDTTPTTDTGTTPTDTGTGTGTTGTDTGTTGTGTGSTSTSTTGTGTGTGTTGTGTGTTGTGTGTTGTSTGTGTGTGTGTTGTGTGTGTDTGTDTGTTTTGTTTTTTTTDTASDTGT